MRHVEEAVQYAKQLMRNGTQPGLAMYKAAHYYGVTTREVAQAVGQCGGQKRAHQRRYAARFAPQDR